MGKINFAADAYLIKKTEAKGVVAYYLQLDLDVYTPSEHYPKEKIQPTIRISREQYEEFKKQLDSEKLRIIHPSVFYT